MGNVKINAGKGSFYLPRFSLRDHGHLGGSSSYGGGEPTPESVNEQLDELSLTDQISKIGEYQKWSRETRTHGMVEHLRRVRLDEFLADRLRQAQQSLGHFYHAPAAGGGRVRTNRPGPAATQSAAQQRATELAAQQFRVAQQAAIAEAAAQAQAVQLLEESVRLNAQATVAQQAVQIATQQVAQLEAQLVIAQAATQEAIQLTQQCAAQRTEVEHTLETVNERVTQTVAQYTAILDEAKKHAEISVSERTTMYAKPAPHRLTPALMAADKFIRESTHIRTAARITAEHAKLQQVTTLALQKAINELAELAQQQVTHRSTAQEQTRAAIDRAAQSMANLSAHQMLTQKDADAANAQLMTVIHRINAQQQIEAQQRATMTAHQIVAPLRQEIAVTPALSGELLDVQARLTAIQEKIQQTQQSLRQIMEMEGEAQRQKLNCEQQKEPQMSDAFANTLKPLMQEYLLRKEQVELEQEQNPLAEELGIAIKQIVVAKEELKAAEAAWLPLAKAGTPLFASSSTPMHPLALAQRHARGAYKFALIAPYQAMLQRKALKAVWQLERDVTQLTIQQVAATHNLQHLIDSQTSQTEIDTATRSLTESTTQLTAMQEHLQEAMAEANRLATDDANAKYQAETFFNTLVGSRAFCTVTARKNDQYRMHYEQSGINALTDSAHTGIWGEHYSTILDGITDAHSLKLEIRDPYDHFAEHQAALQKAQGIAPKVYPAPTTSLTLKSLELLFRYGFDKLTAHDAHALHLDDQSQNFATLLFGLDLLYILIYHAPTIFCIPNRVITKEIPQKSLGYLQHILSNDPEGYQKSSARMFKRFHPEEYAIPLQTSAIPPKHDTVIHRGGISGWGLAESARLMLGFKARLDKKRNQKFFNVIPEIREQGDFGSYYNDAEIDAQFKSWMKSVDATAETINLLDLPAEILKDIQTMSEAIHQTETTQPTTSI